MIINLNTLREMVKAYNSLGEPEHNIKVVKNNLLYNEEQQFFTFNYTLEIGDKQIDNSWKLFKIYIINIVTFFFKPNDEVKDFSIIIDKEKNDIFIKLEIVKKKQKIKRC